MPADAHGSNLMVKMFVGELAKNMSSAFIMKVPDLAAARDRAGANGAQVQGNFAENVGSRATQSIELLDPWGEPDRDPGTRVGP